MKESGCRGASYLRRRNGTPSKNSSHLPGGLRSVLLGTPFVLFISPVFVDPVHFEQSVPEPEPELELELGHGLGRTVGHHMGDYWWR